MSIAGLVLAAGAGRRMGRPKALVRVPAGGPTLLETALGRLGAAGCTPLVVVTGAAGEDVGALAAEFGAEVAHAPDWEGGDECLAPMRAQPPRGVRRGSSRRGRAPDGRAKALCAVAGPDLSRRVERVLAAGCGRAVVVVGRLRGGPPLRSRPGPRS